MIQRIQVLHYRAFKSLDIRLNPFNILIGPNASGKSTFLDVITFLQDLLESNSHAAVEKRSARFNELLWNLEGDRFEISLELRPPKKLLLKRKDMDYSFIKYGVSLKLDAKEGVIIHVENLFLCKDEVKSRSTKNISQSQEFLFPEERPEPEYVVSPKGKRTPSGWRNVILKSTPGNDYFRSETTGWNTTYKLGPHKSSLSQLPEDEEKFPMATWTKEFLKTGIQFLQLNSRKMKDPCRPDLPVTFKEDGSNLPKVVHHLKENNPDLFGRWVKHIKTALPEVESVNVETREADNFLFIKIKYCNGLEIPTWLLSDGTLRLLAQTIIPYLPNENRIFMIEEPENGLHPKAIETVYQSLSSAYKHQVLLASHSPVILRMAKPTELLCFSKTKNGVVDVIRGEEHPKLKDWQKGIDLSILHASGVLQ